MDRKDAERTAELVWDITERTIKSFIAFSQKCEIEDDFIEKSLCDMIVKGFHNLDKEKAEKEENN